MKKSVLYLGILSPILISLLLFAGCAGDDGAVGATGSPGSPGDPGPPGTSGPAIETCVLCHGAERIADVAAMHNTATGTATAVITNASFNPAGDNVSVTFTFTAQDANGNPVPVDLAAAPATGTNLTHLRFTIARLLPGQVYDIGTRDPDSWTYYGPRSHRNKNLLVDNGGGSYTFTFVEGIGLDPAQAGFTHRVGIEIYALPSGLRSVNPTFDWVPNGGALATREIVITAACNECHNPLGYTPSFHGSRRVDTRYCVLCHNPNNALAPQSNDPAAPSVPIPFVKLVHGIHTRQDLKVFEPPDPENHGDFTEVTFPQDILNCTKCHRGGTESDNWKALPSREACGTCHVDVDFDTGAGHVGGAVANNRLCAICHPPSAIEDYHLTTVATPNNPDVPAGLASFEYVIDEVTVNSESAAVVTFHINKDGAALDLSTYPPAGFTGGPSFLVAYALPQDNVAAPADYNNLGRSAGQPASISLANVAGALSGSPAGYTATLSSAPFPAGATLRAVAIQGTFTQTGVDLDGDPATAAVNVGRPTPSFVKAVTGDVERRRIIKSGYVDGSGNPVTDPAAFSTATPIGCLECHESLALHGGSRVNNVQVCVICHNPNLSSSGRTIDPATQTISGDVITAVGSDPLVYPEASMHFKNLIHGIHRASDRPYEFVRNRTSGGLTGFYYNWSEVTFPGNLMACTKCHEGNSYLPGELPAGVLVSTERTTTGDPAEVRSEIAAARDSVPNGTDWVNTPIASACYYCHDSVIVKGHIELNGGRVRAERGDTIAPPTP